MERRILDTHVIIKNNVMYADKLFEDLQRIVDQDKAAGIEIDRYHPTKKLINRFSANFFQAVNIKGFFDCPASQVLQSLLPFVPNEATAIGSTVHAVFERFYKLDGKDRDVNLMYEFAKEKVASLGQESALGMVNKYIDGYISTPDYLDQSKPMDHKGLLCYNELFVKGQFSPLGVELPYQLYSLADRVDFRGDHAYILDYKTGTYLNQKILTIDGYLPQLIEYKWAIEETYGVEVKGGYLLIPGTKEKIAELNISSLENQSRYIDMIFKYKEESQRAAKSRIYPVKNINKWLAEKLNKFAVIEDLPDGSKKINIKYDITLKEPKPKKDEE